MSLIKEETEVKKNIEWLKRSIDKRIKTIESDDISFVGSEYYDEGYIDGMRDVLYRIDQLDEPEITLDKAFEKVAESYLMTKEEIWRHLERLEAHGGKVTYDEPETVADVIADFFKSLERLKEVMSMEVEEMEE